MAKRPHLMTHVYVADCGDGLIKIGATSTPHVRHNGIQTDHPKYPHGTVRMVRMWPHDQAYVVEQTAIRLMAARSERLRWEWFYTSPRRACATVRKAIRMVDERDLV